MADSFDAVKYMIDHVFLPPKLPQMDDFNPMREDALLRALLDALKTFIIHVGPQYHHAIKSVDSMIENLRNILDEKGFVDEGRLADTLRHVSAYG